MNIDVGMVVAGKYELVRLLGKGAMGEVWLATHNSLGGEFAVKLVETTDDIEAETASGRFQLEAQIAAKLSRKTRHIVSVSDHGEEGGTAYLVMEHLEGESLETRLKRTGRLDLAETAAIIMQVGRALGLAHDEGIFHRDLKPANIFLTKDEDGRLLVKLLDFGIARAVKPFKTRSPFATSKDMVLGTPSYMSPEQARGLASLDHRCDLWALATCAYEALARRIPFEGDTVEDIFLSICTFRVIPLRTFRPEISPEVEAFFAKAFANKLEDRFARAQDLADAFEALVDPASLEAFVGPAGASSSRRLPAALPSAPGFATAATAAATAAAAAAAGSSTARIDTPAPLAAMESGGTLSAAAGVPKRGIGVLIGAAVLAALAIGITVFALRESPKDANAAESDPGAAAAASATVTTAERDEIPAPPQQPTEAPTESVVAPPTTAATASTPPVAKKDARKPGRQAGHTTSPPVTTAATTPRPTPPPPPPPTPTPTAPPKKGPHDKGEVF